MPGQEATPKRARSRSARASRREKSWLFAGSDRGGRRAVFMYTQIVTAKMNDVEPEDWLADVLARIAETPQNRLSELLPWNWKTAQALTASAA